MNNHSDYNENVGSVAFYLARKSSGETKKHDFYEVIVITEGVVTLCVNGEKTVLRQGDSVLLCPGVQHALNKYRGIQHTRLLINFDENFARRSLNYFYPGFYGFMKNCASILYVTMENDRLERLIKTARLILTLPEIKSDDLRAKMNMLLAHKAITVFFEKYALKNSDYPEWLSEFIRKMLQPEYIKKKVTEMAEYSNYSYSHLTKLFKQYTGRTLIEYFKEAKLHMAENLLISSDYSCQRISDCAGYKSLSHFTKAFRSAYGTTPSEYRKSFD